MQLPFKCNFKNKNVLPTEDATILSLEVAHVLHCTIFTIIPMLKVALKNTPFLNTGVHTVLGSVDVWELLRVQHRGASQHAHRHDVQLVPAHLREVGQVKIMQ
jgi:hypothetical protein